MRACCPGLWTWRARRLCCAGKGGFCHEPTDGPVPSFVWAICNMTLDQIVCEAPPSCLPPWSQQWALREAGVSCPERSRDARNWAPPARASLWCSPAAGGPPCPGVWGFASSQLSGPRSTSKGLAEVGPMAWVMEGVSHSVGCSLVGNTSPIFCKNLYHRGGRARWKEMQANEQPLELLSKGTGRAASSQR